MVTNEFLASLPTNPGVYIMKNKDDKIIYIGKAKNLKNRVKQYFVHNSGHSPKVLAMVSNIDHLEYIITNSEVEALNLECSLIKKHTPKYNILLKDDKGYPFIKITTQEDYPQILLARKMEDDGAKYFGPYISSFAVKQIIDMLRKVFQIRECRGKILPNPNAKPCLNYHIKRCGAPCIGAVSRQEYQQSIQNAISVLGGKTDGLVKELESKMQEAADQLNFEAAADYRDKINNMNRMLEKQMVVSTSLLDEDIVCLFKESDMTCIQMLYVRNGKLLDKKAFFMNNAKQESDGDILAAFLMQYYSRFMIPQKIFLSCPIADEEVIEEYLSQRKGRKVSLVVPQRGDKVRYIEMARKNASEAIRLKITGYENKGANLEALEQLKKYASLPKLPVRIEAYDISNTAGEETTGSMVVFQSGVPAKQQYRKFKIKSAAKKDDYDAMKEMVQRRLRHEMEKKDGKFAKLPDLILVDGGKGHVHAVTEVVKEFGVDIPVCGIVKDRKHRTRDIVSAEEEFHIPIGTKCFKLATQIQDEMHRVAITYHRHLRSKKNIESELMKIHGIGKAKYKLLLDRFKTINGIKRASVEELMEVKGITEEIANNIKIFYQITE